MPGAVRLKVFPAFPRAAPRGGRTGLWRKARVPAFVVVGLVLLDLVAFAARGTFAPYAPDDYAEKVAGCAARRSDLVIVGGSPVAEGIDPGRLTGLRWESGRLDSAYALGLPGGTVTDFFHAVTRACPTPPRLLVYGVTASDWNDARNEPHGMYSLMTWDDVVRCRMLRPDAAGWVTKQYLEGRFARASAVFRYRNGIRLWAAVRADAVWPGCCPETVKEARNQSAYLAALRHGSGYAPAAWFVHRRYDSAKAAGDPGPPFGFLDKYRIGSHLRYLDELLAWASDRGVAVVLVDMPVTADLEAKYASAFAEYRARLAEWETTRNLVVIRASRDVVGLTDADFGDVIHLNGTGAVKFSTWLRAELEGRGRP
jgi:hypothetical protein